jgi:hypothetical protein
MRAETKAKIARSTKLAMADETVRDKLRNCAHPKLTDDIRAKISAKLRDHYGVGLHKRGAIKRYKQFPSVATTGQAVWHCLGRGQSAQVIFERPCSSTRYDWYSKPATGRKRVQSKPRRPEIPAHEREVCTSQPWPCCRHGAE